MTPGPLGLLVCQQYLMSLVPAYSRSTFSTWFPDATLSWFAPWLAASPRVGAPHPGASAAPSSAPGSPEGALGSVRVATPLNGTLVSWAFLGDF